MTTEKASLSDSRQEVLAEIAMTLVEDSEIEAQASSSLMSKWIVLRWPGLSLRRVEGISLMPVSDPSER